MKPRALDILRRVVQVAAALTVAGGPLIGSLLPAGGDAASQFGWWTSLNQGDTVGPIPTVVPGSSPRAIPPDVPPGGFEVANAPNEVSFAALGYAAAGNTVKRVVLKLAPHGGSIPNSTVQACALKGGGAFASASGGPISQSPKYDCSTPVVGTTDASGGTVTFNVASLVRNDYLGIAIVASGTSRMVFSAPDRATIDSGPPAVGSSVGVTAPESSPPGSSDIPAVAPAVSEGPPTQSAPIGLGPPEPLTPVSPTIPAIATGPRSQPRFPPGIALVAMTEHSYSGGAGSATIGALLVSGAAVSLSIRSRRALAGALAETTVALESGSTNEA